MGMKVALQAAHEDRFSSMAKQMGKWVDQVIGQGFQKYRPAEPWSPAINLYEDETHYCVVVELAGICTKDIEVNVDPDRRILTVRAVISRSFSRGLAVLIVILI